MTVVGNNKSTMDSSYKRTKANWNRPSLNPMGPHSAEQNATYRTRAPWDMQSKELIDEFDQNLHILDADVKKPWDHEAYELDYRDKELRKAADYKYESLWETPPLTAKQQKQLEDYKFDPPFRCAFNGREEHQKSAKKLNPEKKPITRKPWTYGELPPQPATKKIFDRPPTALWEVPRGDQGAAAEQQIVASGDPVLDTLRLQLKKSGASGIAGLSRKFRIMDDSGDGKLDLNEFVKGMKECKIADLTDKAIKHLFRYFGKQILDVNIHTVLPSATNTFLCLDRDDSGFINYDEFLVGIRGVLNTRRKDMVAQAFRVLDSDGSGIVDINDITGRYNASVHPDVIMGKRTEKEVLREFLEAFETGKERDGMITPKEFENYYANVSASIDDDDYFELMIRNAWHISGGEGWCANTTNRRLLVTHSDGRETVEEIKNDIGIHAKDTDKMISRLQSQGVNVATINLNGLSDMHNQVEAKNFYRMRPQLPADPQQTSSSNANSNKSLASAIVNENRNGNTVQNASTSKVNKPVPLGASMRTY
ncbi:hypothetical protein EON65_01950 [archaeon]|nr:MAG: hypothetical protein EON65_01950 [archaeon]